MRTVLAVCACLLLVSCASTGADVVAVSPPASLTVPCAGPVALPERALTDAEIEVMWGRDRSALRACGSRLAGLAAWPG